MITRRKLMAGAGVAAAGIVVLAPRKHPVASGAIIVAQDSEPIALTTAASLDAGTVPISGKIFDRLFVYDIAGHLQPQLATAGDLSADGRTLTLSLRPGVKWHDGQPFGAKDVACSVQRVWKKYHARSTIAYADLVAIDTPDPLTAILRFSRPVPFIFSCMADGASQVVPAHLYGEGDILSNPHNVAPIGTGPYKFATWQRGSHLVLARNPHYWDGDKPVMERLIFRFLPDGAAMIAAVETGSAHYFTGANVPPGDLGRLRQEPAVAVDIYAPTAPTFEGFAFNLDRPMLRDPRVRHAFAHAIDRDFILANVLQGRGDVMDSPIARQFTLFHSNKTPQYPYDLARASALLDQAGLVPDADGVRLSLFLDVQPPGLARLDIARFIRSSLAKIGVRLELRSENIGQYIKRIYTDRDFDTTAFGSSTDPDPVLGIQRYYSTKTFKRGVPFSNITHYGMPDIDALFDAAQIDVDPIRRRLRYEDIQIRLQTDLPMIPLVASKAMVIRARRLTGTLTTNYDNFANARLQRT